MQNLTYTKEYMNDVNSILQFIILNSNEYNIFDILVTSDCFWRLCNELDEIEEGAGSYLSDITGYIFLIVNGIRVIFANQLDQGVMKIQYHSIKEEWVINENTNKIRRW